MPGSEERPSSDVDARFEAIVATFERELADLTRGIDEFRRSYETFAGSLQTDPQAPVLLATARDRVQRLELARAHVASSLAYLRGGDSLPQEHDEVREIAARVLDGLEAERQRLYREVHDGPAQVLANAIFETEFLERIADRAAPDVRAQLRAELATVRAQLRESLDGVREMIFDLRPPALAQLGLVEAMRAYAGEFQARSGLVVETELRAGPTGLAPEKELAIYRVLQEALQNVQKHAAAKRVVVSWRREDARWTLRVADDGSGFDVARVARKEKRFGLVTMRERAEVIGASFDVRSAPGAGTTVVLNIAA